MRGRLTHADEREGAARVDRDAHGEMEKCAAVVAVSTLAMAGERGGPPGGEVDTANVVVVSVLRCMMGRHAERGASQRSVAEGTTFH